MRKFLLISPYFPPMGVSGAKRPLHLARNLPSFGWQPVVLAGRPLGEAVDESLAAALPSGTVVAYEYVGSLRPLLHRLSGPRNPAGKGDAVKRGGRLGRSLKYLTPFDRYLWDTPAAVRAGSRLIREHGLEAIHVMADPWSGLIAALRLHRRSGLPLVVDLRDPWSVHEGKMALRPRVSRWYLGRFERRLFQAASKIVLNTASCEEAYVRAYDGIIPKERFTTVRNAFDAGLFAGASAAPEGRAFTVLYFGTFRLFVGPEQILEGFARFVANEHVEASEARLVFVGGLRDADLALVRRLGLEGHVEVRPAVPFCESLAVLSTADALILTVEPDCRLQIPGKLYDYLAAGRPVLAISANEEVNRLLAETGAGAHAPFGDADAVAQHLARLFRGRGSDGPRALPKEAVEPFGAKEQARRVAAILDEVTRP